MSKQIVHRWCRQFSEGRQSVHDEKSSGRPSLINVDLVERVMQRVIESRRFTITELSSHFLKISLSLLHEMVTKHRLFKKSLKKIQKIEDVCRTLVPFAGGRVPRQSDTKVDPTILNKCLNSGVDFVEK
ncbi:uncharacterized protein TNCV_3679441 [Trichonephila clavipes]|nr:uncharacterized protein TNCV_3679441 [Trichonephila clavipes]